MGLEVLAHHYLRRQPHRDAYKQAEAHLPYHLILPFQAILVVELELAVVIQESDAAHPQRGDNHQYQVYVPEIAHQQARHKCREDYDDASHGGRPFLLHLALQTEIAHVLPYLHHAQAADYGMAEHQGHQQGQRERYARAEGDVSHQVATRKVEVAELLQHPVLGRLPVISFR